MTKQQKKDVRKVLRQYGRALKEPGSRKDRKMQAWGKVIGQTMDYYAKEDPVCAELLRRRYLDGESEWDVVGELYIGRTTYYRKELEVLSTVAVHAAKAGLI